MKHFHKGVLHLSFLVELEFGNVGFEEKGERSNNKLGPHDVDARI